MVLEKEPKQKYSNTIIACEPTISTRSRAHQEAEKAATHFDENVEGANTEEHTPPNMNDTSGDSNSPDENAVVRSQLQGNIFISLHYVLLHKLYVWICNLYFFCT